MTLSGWKTYLVAALAVLAALAGYLGGELTLLQAVTGIGLALGLGGNRSVARATEIINSPYNSGQAPDAQGRMITTYIGIAISIITAVLAYVNGEQDITVTVAAVLAALGLNFLGLGIKKAAAPA